MELRNIATFLRVAELESFTQAANELGYVQSTITAQIKQLETEIGMPLFDRFSKKISLTPMGTKLMPYARELLHVTEEVASLNAAPLEISGTLRVGGLESLYTWILTEKLLKYHEQFPLVRIETCVASRTELFGMLRHGELDIIYLLDKKRLEHDLVRAYFSPTRIVFVTHPGNPLTGSRHIELADIAKEPLILTERGGIYRCALEEMAAENDIDLKPFLEVNSTSIIIRLILSGMGISLLPEYTVREEINEGRLWQLNVSGCDILMWRQIFYHKNKWVTPQMSKLIEIIKQN